MVQNQLVASIRKTKGKSANHKLRQAGKIPATLYGPRGNILLEMTEESTRHILEKMSGIAHMDKLWQLHMYVFGARKCQKYNANGVLLFERI